MIPKKFRFIIYAIIIGLFMQTLEVLAWGPERPTYTNEAPADHATFNSITNNPVFGDERDFVRIVEKKADDEPKDTYSSDLMLEAGKQYEVVIYYHNDASSTYNDEAHDNVGVALDTRVMSLFPEKLAAGEKGKIDGMITSSNSEPKSVWDEAYITAKENMAIGYVKGTARIYNDWDTNKMEVSEDLFTSKGAFIGLDQLDGLILGCYEFSGYITYTLQTVTEGESIPDEVTDLVKPTPEETTDKEVAPEETIGTANKTLIAIVSILTVTVIILAIVIAKLLRKKTETDKNK